MFNIFWYVWFILFYFREEPAASILQQHHGQLLRWVEERRSRHEVMCKFCWSTLRQDNIVRYVYNRQVLKFLNNAWKALKEIQANAFRQFKFISLSLIYNTLTYNESIRINFQEKSIQNVTENVVSERPN